MKRMSFNEFCHKCCDGMYEPRLPENMQCTGYKELKKMIIENITPASLEEIEKWENNPNIVELFTIPDVKYLRFLHPLLRPYIINNWAIIKNMDIS